VKTLSKIAVLAWMAAPAFAQENLPPGQGRSLVLEACVQCHDLRAVVSQRKSEAAWRRTVDEMIWRGTPLMPGEADVVTKYLTSTFGTDSGGQVPVQPKAAVLDLENGRYAKYLPPGRGRALVVGACVQCHDLALTVTQRKTRQAWHRSVEQMAHLGAPLNGSEIHVVAAYLARAFGPDDPIPAEIRNR
jgi:mono/diheme cytochrome c family protein